MKKLLLMLSAAALTSVAASGQARLALYEEFTGENCGPCAASNPTLDANITGGGANILKIQFQVPIPSAGPIYNQYTTVTAARQSYYSVPFAPYGRMDGIVLGTGSNPGHVNYCTPAAITAEEAVAPKFTITVTHSWNATGDSVTANVGVMSIGAYTTGGTNKLKLRIAIVEHLQFTTPPGTNGETDFPNVVREMVPDAGGTTMLDTWTASQTANYTIKGKVPSFIDKAKPETRLVVWIQNDVDQSVLQAAQSTHTSIATDAGTTATTTSSSIACAASSTTVGSTVTLKNTGTTTLTSAKVFARADNSSTYTSANWTGTLAPNATASVSVPAVTLTTGTRYVIDSVALPNGGADVNQGNNISKAMVIVYNTTGNPLPLSTGFENAGALPANWIIWDYDKNGNVPVMGWSGSTTTFLGHANSTWTLWFRFPYEPSGETNYVIMPQGTLPAGAKALDFWVAHALRTGAGVDKLEVVYSTNCASSWTTAWSQTGTQLATGATTANNTAYAPAQSEWKKWSVDMTNVPAGAMIAFRGIGASGNNMFVDDVALRTGPAGVENIISNSNMVLYPNPARESATLDFNLTRSGKITVSVLDAIGRTVAIAADANMPVGTQHITIPTANLAAGVYNVSIKTEEGALTQRLSVVK